MRGLTFSKRTVKEILRDPLSYIFCIGFPVVMLIIMTIVNSSIPASAGMTVFELKNLAPGIAIFGLTFVMLFTSTQVSKDRTTALITRLHASPMKSQDYIIGYTLPVIAIGIAQIIVTYIASIIVSFFVDYSFNYVNLFVSVIFLIPTLIMYVAFGLIFGTLFSEKSAPGMCSIIISVVGMIGGIWMDIENMGGAIKKVGMVLPFFRGVKCGRLAVTGDYSEILPHFLLTIAWSVGLYIFAVFVMDRKLKSDIK